MATGLPADGAEFITTYNYVPFPWLPFEKFQVHCRHGVVESIELFDD